MQHYRTFLSCLLGLLLVCLKPVSGDSQDPYRLDRFLDSYILIGGGLALGVDYLLNQNLEPIVQSEFLLLDADDINGFDRLATRLNVPGAGTRSDFGMYVPFVVAGTSLIYYGVRGKKEIGFWHHSAKLGLLLLETNLVNFVVTDLTKNLVQRPRPYVYNPEFQSGTGEFGVNARKSFFSGHTSFSAANSFFFAKVFADYHPDSKWRPLVWTLAAAIPAWTGLERVLAGKHFPTDVITGYAVGALCGYFIPHFHLKGSNQNLTLFPKVASGYFGAGFVWVL
jgi:membrane-associated phospholipid phosphatase